MGKVIQLKPTQNVPNTLRNIADLYEQGEFEGTCTLVIGTEVFHFGASTDENAAVNTIWDLEFGIHKLMSAALADE